MSDLVVRRLLVDLSQPFERHWNGGDVFSSAFLNALSMSFPVGEQFFIDSVREGQRALDPETAQRFAGEIQGFIGQEATHRRLHGLFNEHLARQGYFNHWEPRAKQRLKRLEGMDCRHAVAATAATEHFTAIFAQWVLEQPGLLAGAEPRLQTLWEWHASEESEHRSTAFDLYKALGGDERWRRIWMRRVTVLFLTDAVRQTCNNLWRDGELFRLKTWRGAWRLLFGQQGLVTRLRKPWREYFDKGFHPSQHDDRLSQQWLQSHAAYYSVVARF